MVCRSRLERDGKSSDSPDFRALLMSVLREAGMHLARTYGLTKAEQASAESVRASQRALSALVLALLVYLTLVRATESQLSERSMASRLAEVLK